jgi:hypothetical protein
MVAPSQAHAVPARSARKKLISHLSTSTPAGIIATSDGNGIKLDSMVIMTNIPIYHREPKNPTTESIKEWIIVYIN